MMRHPVTGKDKSSFGVIAHQVFRNNLGATDSYYFYLAKNN